MPAVGTFIMDLVGAQKFTVYTLIGRGVEIPVNKQGLYLPGMHSSQRVIQTDDALLAFRSRRNQCFNQFIFPLALHLLTDFLHLLQDVILLLGLFKTECAVDHAVPVLGKQTLEYRDILIRATDQDALDSIFLKKL